MRCKTSRIYWGVIKHLISLTLSIWLGSFTILPDASHFLYLFPLAPFPPSELATDAEKQLGPDPSCEWRNPAGIHPSWDPGQPAERDLVGRPLLSVAMPSLRHNHPHPVLWKKLRWGKITLRRWYKTLVLFRTHLLSMDPEVSLDVLGNW